jgi:hypothetical protein
MVCSPGMRRRHPSLHIRASNSVRHVLGAPSLASPGSLSAGHLRHSLRCWSAAVRRTMNRRQGCRMKSQRLTCMVGVQLIGKPSLLVFSGRNRATGLQQPRALAAERLRRHIEPLQNRASEHVPADLHCRVGAAHDTHHTSGTSSPCLVYFRSHVIQ